jgi:hypothetical protein
MRERVDGSAELKEAKLLKKRAEGAVGERALVGWIGRCRTCGKVALESHVGKLGSKVGFVSWPASAKAKYKDRRKSPAIGAATRPLSGLKVAELAGAALSPASARAQLTSKPGAVPQLRP